jgi:PAS domain S-box-containing protein
MFAAAVHNPSHTKTDRELRESHQDLRESRQDLRQVDQDLQQTSQDRRETSQNSREYGQNIRESWQDLRQVDQDLQQTSQDLRESRLELLESEERFRLLVESSTDCAIYMLDPEGKVVKWNDGAERSQGYKAEEILGRNYSVLFAPEDAEAGLPAQELAVAARDGRFETAAWRQRKNGARFWALVTLTAIRGPEGELRGFSKVTRDMTAQRAVEESLRIHNAQLERFRVIVENVADYVIFTLDAKGRFDSWSPGALNILGFTAEEALGREYSLTFTKAEIEAEEPRREIEEAARNGHCATENWQIRKDGSLFWSSGVLTAIKDRAGKVTGYIRVASDMTAQKRLEEAQLGINAELEIRVAERTRELKVLLREVYHRVKNNLQVIQSLLKMRARLLPEGETRVAIDSTVQRIYAMSLAHEHLYRMDAPLAFEVSAGPVPRGRGLQFGAARPDSTPVGYRGDFPHFGSRYSLRTTGQRAAFQLFQAWLSGRQKGNDQTLGSSPSELDPHGGQGQRHRASRQLRSSERRLDGLEAGYQPCASARREPGIFIG